MSQHDSIPERSPQQIIEAALARIEAASPDLHYPDHWLEEAARRYIHQSVNAIRYHLRNAERTGRQPALPPPEVT